ncbi:GTP-binding protein ypt2-like [Drosophila serrata]|uniref:GTP-binding protein ypt2-like n=1 Tax=Drosophila serrata TaxID=7274 RepID=UPI000A1D0757|nr:GTP-binding protein ypt2-like [Drosophila serrata]
MGDYSYSVLIIGDTSVGKSALLCRATEDDFYPNYYSPAIIDLKHYTVQLHEKKILLTIDDVAGEDRFRTIQEDFCSKAQGVILVFDTTSRSSLENLSNWVLTFSNVCPKEVNVILVGTKCDELEERQVTQEEAANLADQFNVTYIEASAKTGSNVKNVFNVMAVELYFRNVLKRVPPPWPESSKMAIAVALDESLVHGGGDAEGAGEGGEGDGGNGDIPIEDENIAGLENETIPKE